MTVKAELNEAGDRIEVRFAYDQRLVMAMREVPGAKFIPPPKGGPYFRLPLDLTSARRLREAFGDDLELGRRLKTWGKETTAEERNLRSLALADDAELARLPEVLPKLHKFVATRPYQLADIAFMAQANCINANEPGLGKTVELIGSVFEAGLEEGSKLIVAPKTSLEVVWQYELERWQDQPVLLTSGDDSPYKRQVIMEEAWDLASEDKPFWLVVNPAMVRLRRDTSAEPIATDGEDGKPIYPLVPAYDAMFDIIWDVGCLDEYHKTGLTNPSTMLAQAVKKLDVGRRYLLSGTPMGGKPLKLWGGLNYLAPKRFTSKWRWYNEWLEIEENEAGYKSVHNVKAGREDDFYEHLAPYLLRRTKSEVLPQLPPKQHVEIWCDMTPPQKKQYTRMAQDAEIKIADENLSVTSILAEYMRLKQFADARCKVSQSPRGRLEVKPTVESGKLPHVLALLEERGITAKDPEGDEQVVIASQFSAVVDMVHKWLVDQGIPADKITGATKSKGKTGTRTRADIVRDFQAEGGPRVIVMSTTAGGVSITLDRASTVIILDETWDPDDQTQLEDRVHRGSRIHQVTCYYLRSKDSIEEYIKEVTFDKGEVNKLILDLRRRGFRADDPRASARRPRRAKATI